MGRRAHISTPPKYNEEEPCIIVTNVSTEKTFFFHSGATRVVFVGGRSRNSNYVVSIQNGGDSQYWRRHAWVMRALTLVSWQEVRLCVEAEDNIMGTIFQAWKSELHARGPERK